MSFDPAEAEHSKFSRNLWRWVTGKPEAETLLEHLQDTEWSPIFERLMRNRLLMGAFRYGRIGAPGKPVYDRVKSCIKRLEQYAATGNKELLVDVANLCLLEFVECVHPLAHFKDSGDDVEHVEVKKGTK